MPGFDIQDLTHGPDIGHDTGERLGNPSSPDAKENTAFCFRRILVLLWILFNTKQG